MPQKRRAKAQQSTSGKQPAAATIKKTKPPATRGKEAKKGGAEAAARETLANGHGGSASKSLSSRPRTPLNSLGGDDFDITPDAIERRADHGEEYGSGAADTPPGFSSAAPKQRGISGGSSSNSSSAVLAAWPSSDSGRDKLVKHLRLLAEVLKGLSQDVRPPGLAETAKELISPGVAQHRDKEVKLLVACCLVDILRIYAPEAPYTPAQLCDVFALLCLQLRGLSMAISPADPKGPRLQYILESLASVKSCCIVVELAAQRIRGGEDALLELFDCLLTSVRPEHPQHVADRAFEVLEACAEEFDAVPQALLDAILMCLLPVTKKENPRSYWLAMALLRKSFNRFHQAISQFINSVLTGAVDSSEVDLSEHVFHLIYELHKVHPQMLLYVLPNVALQLQAEDVETRQRAVSSLGRLFGSPRADYGRQFARNWRDLLGRFKDKEAKIRAQMVQVGAAILRAKPDLRTDLREELGMRLLDLDWEVRLRAVNELGDVAADDLEAVGGELLRQVGERMKDKRPDVHKAAATGLAIIYQRHVSYRWAAVSRSSGNGIAAAAAASESLPAKIAALNSESTDEEDPELASLLAPPPPPGVVAELAGWVPDLVLCCYAYDSVEMKLRVTMLLDEKLLPQALGERARAAGLIQMYGSLGASAKLAVRAILTDRRRCQAAVRRYLEAHEALRAEPEDLGREEAVKAAMVALLEECPTSDRRLTLLQRLQDHKDQRVFKLLASLCDPCVATSIAEAARQELAKKVGSKTPLAEYLRLLTRRCTVLSLTRRGLAHAAAVCQAAIAENDSDARDAALAIVEAQSAVFPEQLRGSVPALVAAFEETDRGTSNAGGKKNGYGAAASDESDDDAGSSEDDDGGGGGGGGKGPRGRGGKRSKRGGGAGGGRSRQKKADTAVSSDGGAGGQSVQARLLRVLARARGVAGDVPDQLLQRLQLLACRARTPDVAKQAVHTLHALAASSGAEEAAKRALRQLVGDQALSTSNPRLVAVLRALSAFAQLFPNLFAVHSEHVVSFVKERILLHDDSLAGDKHDVSGAGSGDDAVASKGQGSKARGKKRGGGAASKRDRHSGSNPSPECERLCASLDLLCSWLLPLRVEGAAGSANGGGGGGSSAGDDAEGGSGGGGSSSSVEARAVDLAGAAEVMDMLVGVVESRGDAPSGEAMSAIDRDELRVKAAQGLLQLMRNKGLDALLTPQRWLSLAWVLLDSAETVRSRFLSSLCAFVVEGNPSLRFVAYLCLVGSEPEHVKKEAKAAYMVAVRRRRSAYEAGSAALVASGGGGGGGKGKKRSGAGGRAAAAAAAADAAASAERDKLSMVMPEYVMPYVIHLLAHHPDFPEGASDAPRVKLLKKCLGFNLDLLVGSLGPQADNLSFLLQMMGQLGDAYVDRLEPKAGKVALVARLCRELLQPRIKVQDNLQAYPGQIFVPTHLFAAKKPGDVRKSIGGAGDAGDAVGETTPPRAQTRGAAPAPWSDATSASAFGGSPSILGIGGGNVAGPSSSNAAAGRRPKTPPPRGFGPKSGRSVAQKRIEEEEGDAELPDWGSPVAPVAEEEKGGDKVRAQQAKKGAGKSASSLSPPPARASRARNAKSAANAALASNAARPHATKKRSAEEVAAESVAADDSGLVEQPENNEEEKEPKRRAAPQRRGRPPATAAAAAAPSLQEKPQENGHAAATAPPPGGRHAAAKQSKGVTAAAAASAVVVTGVWRATGRSKAPVQHTQEEEAAWERTVTTSKKRAPEDEVPTASPSPSPPKVAKLADEKEAAPPPPRPLYNGKATQAVAAGAAEDAVEMAAAAIAAATGLAAAAAGGENDVESDEDEEERELRLLAQKKRRAAAAALR